MPATNKDLQSDQVTAATIFVDYEHHELHEGDHYFVQDYVDLPISNVFDLQFTTANTSKWTHFIFGLDCEAETLWYIYEGVTITTPGTAVTPVNNNRNSTNTSGNTVASILNTSVSNANSDTAVAGATLLAQGIIGALRNGGATERAREIILKQNTAYAFRAVATQAGFVAFVAEWYEHTSI